MINKLSILILLIISIAMQPPVQFNEAYTIAMLTIVALASVIFFINLHIRKTLHFLAPSFLCFIGIIIVHFQSYVDYLLGFDVAVAQQLYDLSIVPLACRVSTIGTLAFVLGYLIVAPIQKPSLRQHNRPLTVESKNRLIVASLVLYGLFLSLVGKSYLSGFYGGSSYWGSLALQIFPLFSYSLSAVIIVSYHRMVVNGYNDRRFSNYIRQIGLIPSLIVLLHLLFSLYVGDRGPVISISLLYFGYYFHHCRKFSFTAWVVIILGAAAFMSAIAMIRTSDLSDTRSFSERVADGTDVFSYRLNRGRSILPITEELARSVRCLHVAVDVTTQVDF